MRVNGYIFFYKQQLVISFITMEVTK